MNLSKLDAFKAKANSVLMAEALLHVSGGMLKAQDAEDCHCDDRGMRRGKSEITNYSQCQLDHFFANSNLAARFDSLYSEGDIDLANKRLEFMESMIAQG
jgi:hypothetical protein